MIVYRPGLDIPGVHPDCQVRDKRILRFSGPVRHNRAVSVLFRRSDRKHGFRQAPDLGISRPGRRAAVSVWRSITGCCALKKRLKERGNIMLDVQ